MVRFIFLKCPKAHSVDVTMKLTALIWSFIRVDGTGTEIVEVFFLCIFQKFVHIFRSDKCDSSRFCWRFCAKELSVSALCLTYVFTKTVVLWNPNSLVIYSFIYLNMCIFVNFSSIWLGFVKATSTLIVFALFYKYCSLYISKTKALIQIHCFWIKNR